MHKQKVIISVGLIAVEIILLITGFGEISNGSLSITILHIPVILAAILWGNTGRDLWHRNNGGCIGLWCGNVRPSVCKSGFIHSSEVIDCVGGMVCLQIFEKTHG